MTSGTAITEQAIWQRALGVIPGGVNSATRRLGSPYGFARAAGSRIHSIDGTEYIDYHAAFGAILLGHCHPYVDEAVRASIGAMDLAGWGVTEIEVEFARLATALIPSAEKVIATMSGTEATFQAVRLARGVTGRSKLVKFQGCFHGGHDAVARNVISPPERAWGKDPLSAGILDAALEQTLIAEFNDLASVEALFAEHEGDVAAVILEPVPHNVGALLPEPAFLAGLRELTRRSGAILIFDEVISGFRHALGGYQELCGVMPDLTTFGKALGNGYPVAGMGGRAELMDHFNSAGGDVLLAGTFNGHPCSLAAAIATMTYLRDNADEHYGHVRALGARMREGLQAIVDELGIVAQAQGLGSVFCLYFCQAPIRGYRDLMRNDDEAYATFQRRMTDAGALMIPLSLKRNHISGAHTAEDVDRTLEMASRVLTGMREERLLATA